MDTIIANASQPYNLHERSDIAYSIPVSQMVDLSGNEDFYLFNGTRRNLTRGLIGRLNHVEGSTATSTEEPVTKSQSKKVKNGIIIVAVLIVIAFVFKRYIL